MNLLNKEVLVIGLGISGLSTVKALNKIGAKISIADSKDEESLKDVLREIKDINFKGYFGSNPVPLDNIDLIVKSPGVPPRTELLLEAEKYNIDIITDIELAYLLSPTKNLIAITGTNGKTTTTSLTGKVFKEANFKTHIVGNIGVGILEEIFKSNKDSIFVIEASSFQLENTSSFKPKISLILNISPDHLDWHGSYDHYIKAKKKIFKNQGKDDYTVLNYDDEIIRTFKDEINSNIIWFSLKEKLSKGIYVDNGDIIISDETGKRKVISISDIKLLGEHNLENILGSIGITYAMGIDLRVIEDVIKNFTGIEHRLEFVDEKRGIRFYNDSKGTNIEASIKAIEAIDTPIVLIAGGYDKGVEFDEFINSFHGKVKGLILLGETKNKIQNAAIRNNFKDYYLVENMKEAVDLSYKLSDKGDSVLLSPACASWGMYKSFEERGKVFKELVKDLKEE